jgi:general secretion pathway protein J
MMRHSQARGFTLIELMVAISIFAVLTIAGWQVFNNLIKVRERTSIKAEQLAAIQEAYEQLSRDFSQALARPVQINGNSEAAFYLSSNEFHLTRTGVIDPLQLGTSPLARVQYLLVQGQLIRQSYAQVDQSGNLVPSKTVLLSKVTDWTVTALDTGSTQTWPIDNTVSTTPGTPTGNNKLPLAVQVTLTVNGTPLRWLFAMLPNMPQPVAAVPNGTNNPASAPAAANAAVTSGAEANSSTTITRDGH